MRRLSSIVGATLLFAACSSFVAAQDTVINLGTISSFDSPNDLDLSGSIVYAVNLGGVARTINGVNFTPSASTPGFSVTGAANPTVWSSYNFTGPPAAAPGDIAQLNTLMSEIFYGSGTTLGEYHFNVTPGNRYKIQYLYGENNLSETSRSWDIAIEGALAVDKTFSNGAMVGGVIPNYPGNTMATVWTLDNYLALDSVLTISLGQIPGSNAFQGADPNYIAAGFIIQEIVPEPASIATWIIAGVGMLLGAGIYRRRGSKAKLAI